MKNIGFYVYEEYWRCLHGTAKKRNLTVKGHVTVMII